MTLSSVHFKSCAQLVHSPRHHVDTEDACDSFGTVLVLPVLSVFHLSGQSESLQLHVCVCLYVADV